ncbi:papain-like cysteine protease family protein [Achromobacter arsenitoxydans]|uniref:papain-like cysteine protease family protein n=1 Tax=Achromobacter arsenitoxydans TaxID=1147684 RepID=UPI001112BE35
MFILFKSVTLLALSLYCLAAPSNAQPPTSFDYRRYPPIHHAVPFHPQQTMVWCWVAAAKMVAEFYGRSPVPDQCSMLQIQYRAPCCQNPQLCSRPGHITEVQALISRFGGRFSTVSPPADGFALYDILKHGPIVMHTRQGAGHFVIATGMRVVPSPFGPLGRVSINDPFYGQYEVDFPSLMQAWTAALVVY